MGLLASLAPGLGTLAGGLLTNSSNKREAERNRSFQERMSSTAHQREVEDLKKAGLNPLLSGTGGSGASTPTGGAAVLENAVAPAVASSLEGQRLRKDLDLAQSQIDAQKAGAIKDTETSKNINAQTKVLGIQMGAIKGKAKFDEMQTKWNQDAIHYDNIINRLGGTINAIPLPKIKKPIPRMR